MANLEMKSLRDIEYIAGELLSQGANPTRKHRILRDVFRLPADDRSLQACRAEMLQSKWIQQLKQEMGTTILPETFSSDLQLNTQSLSKLEKAVGRSLNLGLDRDDEILVETASKLSRALSIYLQQAGDGAAVSWGWPTIHIAAGLLAQIDPWNASLDLLWAQWFQVAEKALLPADTGKRMRRRKSASTF